MQPKSFCHKPEGDYYPWAHGDVSSVDLQRWRPDNDGMYINGVLVYGLFFWDAEAQRGRKWNCKTGWEEKGML